MSGLSSAHRAELQRLAALTAAPAVRAFLEATAAALPMEQQPAAPSAPPPAPLAPLLPQLSAQPPPAAEGSITYMEPRHAWEQDNDFITVLAMDLPPFLTKEAKAAVTCSIREDAVDLLVPPNFRLRLAPLEKSINVAESSFKVKKTQVEIRLRKKEKWEHWAQLLAKSRAAKEAMSKDPGASINELMRDMYNDGDAATKKMLAEAMMKSREGKDGMGGMGGMGGGLGGDGLDDL